MDIISVHVHHRSEKNMEMNRASNFYTCSDSNRDNTVKQDQEFQQIVFNLSEQNYLPFSTSPISVVKL